MMFDILVRGCGFIQKNSNISLICSGSISDKGSRNIFLTFLFLFFTFSGNATNYYVSNSGNDSNPGRSESLPWKTLAKVNASTFKAGDQILFKRGGVWREQLKVRNSGAPGNPITFGAYGTGDSPVIDGADVITGMIGKAMISKASVEQITVAANRDFSDDTGWWTKTEETTIAAGVCNILSSIGGGSALLKAGLLTVEKSYKITYTVTRNGGGQLKMQETFGESPIPSTVGTHTLYAKALTSHFQIARYSGFTDIDIDNLSVEEISADNLPVEELTSLEQVTVAANRDFSIDTGWWTKTEETTIAAGVCNILSSIGGGSALLKTGLLTVGKSYKITYTVTRNGGGQLKMQEAFDESPIPSTVGTHTLYAKALTSHFQIARYSGFTDIDIDNLSIEEISADNLPVEELTSVEQITVAANRDFSNDTGWWTKKDDTSIAAGVCNILSSIGGGSALLKTGLLTVGKSYKITYTVTRNGGGQLKMQEAFGESPIPSTVGTHTLYAKALTSHFQIARYSGFTDIDIDNLSIEEISADNAEEISTDKIWEKTGITTKPYLMFLNGSMGMLKASAAECTSEGDWFWDNTTNIFYIYSESDPNGKVELGQRGILVDAQYRNHITIKDFTFQHSNNNNTIGSNSRGAVFMMFGSYLTVSGCTFKDNSRNGLHVIDSPHITVDNNTFLRNGQMNNLGHNFAFTAFTPGMTDITFSNNICSYAGWNGCVIYTGKLENRITNVDIHGNTFDYNKGAGAYTIKCDFVAVYNNTFDSNGDPDLEVGEDYAFGSEGCNNIDFYNNTITNDLNNDAIQFYSDAKESGHNVRIFRNYIYGAKDGDCIGINSHDNLTSQNMQIFSNVLINADYRGIGLYRDGAGVSSTPLIYNNTFYGNKVADIGTMANGPAIIKNNIFGSETTNVIAGKLLSGLTTSNNLYGKTSGNVLSYNSTNYTTATITNFEGTANTDNPLFTDAANGDFTLQTGSPAINAGVDLGLTKDILGNPIVGLPDIGAYEKQTLSETLKSAHSHTQAKLTTGIIEFESIKIEMFPNPAKDKINIRFSSMPEKGTRIELTDMAGRQFMVREVQLTQEVLNIQPQPPGMYLVKTISGDNYTVKKLIIN